MLIPAGSTRPYPQGRTKDLIKVKRHKDTEAVVIGFKPLVRDTGEVCEMLGSLQCLLPNGKTFYMSGFNDKERVDIWHDQAGHLNRIVSFKYLEIGSYEVPRHPIFRGFRSL
jgi:DNA ligase-1